MSAPATQAAQTDPGPQAADPHGHREVLHDLITMGTGIARILHGQIVAQAQPAPPTDPTSHATAAQPAPAPVPGTLIGLAAAFDQVARAVRRCILLAQSLDKPAAPASDPARHRTAARKQIIRAVEDKIQRPCFATDRDRDADTAEALRAELHERLDAPDLDDDIASRPVADIIEEIIRDLHLDTMPGTRPFQRRTPADVALLCARAAAPGRSRQDGAAPHDAGPLGPTGVTQHPPGPQPDTREPNPGIPSRPQPAPVRPGLTLPDNPAEAIATVLRHASRADARWRPPPGG